MSTTIKYLLKAKDQTKAGVKSAKKGFGSLDKSVAALRVGLLAGGAAMVAFGAAAQATARSFDDLAKQSKRLGIAVDQLDAWNYAVQLGGSSSESFAKGIRTLNKYILDISSGSGQQAKRAFESIGMSVDDLVGEDGSFKNSTAILLEMADAFAESEDSGKKLAAAATILGRAGSELVPILDQGSDAIREQLIEAQILGTRYADMTAKGEDAIDAQLRISRATRNVGDAIMVHALPQIATMTDWLAIQLVNALTRTDEEYRRFIAGLRVGDPAAAIRDIESEITKLDEKIALANDGMRDIGADMTGISEFTKGRMRANSELQRTLDGLSAERKYAEHQLSLSREQLALQERILRQQKEKREEMEKQRSAEKEVSGPQVNAADQRANEEALESELRLHERRRDLLAQGSSLESSLMTEQESRNERQARYNLLLDEGAISLETYTRAMARLGEESVESVEGQSESMDGLTQSQERMGAGFDAVWGSMLDGPEAMGKAMQRLGMQLAGAAIKKMILDKFVGSAATSVKAAEGAAGYHAAYSIIPFAGPGLAAMNIAKMYGDIAAASGIGAAIGAAAEGGYASGMTLVGERGPEIVNFRTPGQVTPNHAIGNMGGGPTINVTIQGDLISDDTSKDNLARDIYERLGQMGAA